MENGVQRTIENKTAAKMAIPPRFGTAPVWELLSLGLSERFLILAICMIDGMAKYVNEKAVMNASIISYMGKV